MTVDAPWNKQQWWRVIGLNALGAVALALSWWFVRSADSFEAQERWIVVGIVCVVAAIGGCVVWLTNAMRQTKQLQHRVVARAAAIASLEKSGKAGIDLRSNGRVTLRQTR